MLKILLALSAVVVGFSATAEPATCVASLNVNPLLYRIERGSHLGYVFGTYTPGFSLNDFPAPVLDAIVDSTALVGELKPNQVVSRIMAMALASQHTFTKEKPGYLREQLSPEDYEFLKMRLRVSGQPEQAVDRLSVFSATLHAWTSAGYENEPDLVESIEWFGQQLGLPRAGLETPLARAQQRVRGFDLAHLKFTIAEEKQADAFAPKKPRHEIAALFFTGNENGLSTYKARWAENMPESFKHLFRDRASEWLPQFEYQLKRNDRPFFYVGALHLVEPNGVLRGLRDRGYRVERIDH